MTLLDDIVHRAGTDGAVVVFDLDSTLISTSVRHLDALRRHGWATGGRVGEVTAAAGLHQIRWSPEEVLQSAGLSTEGLMDRWLPWFFSDRCRDDVPTPGAQRFVRRVHAAGATVVYLTARTKGPMGRGTMQTLLDWGFPALDGRTVVMLKPHRELGDGEYKQQAMTQLAALGTVVATFENEPGHANAFLGAFPDAQHVLLDTCHGPGAPALDDGIAVIADFW